MPKKRRNSGLPMQLRRNGTNALWVVWGGFPAGSHRYAFASFSLAIWR